MNYLWDFILRAEAAGYKETDLTFLPAKSYSPYMELSFEDLNTSECENPVIELNPYYRYYRIFKDLFPPGETESLPLRMELFDILIHHLLHIDRYGGMNQEEFFIRFLRRDIETGCMGETVKDQFQTFSFEEQKILLQRLLLLYQTGNAFSILELTMPLFFLNCSIYRNTGEKEEILLYLGEKRTEESEKRKELLLTLFLPVSAACRVYWEYHFGIIGVDQTMQMDHIQLY